MLLLTFLAVRDERAAVAIPAAGTIGFVVLVVLAAGLSGWTSQVWQPSIPGGGGASVRAGAANGQEAEPNPGLTIAQGLVLLISFGILTAVPAAVIVAAVTILGNRKNATPQTALPVILLVGMVGLLGVLALTVAVLARFNLVNPAQPLGLPEGSIQAVIALSLILIFAIVGVYLHASTADGDLRDNLTTQLFTTISTLVVAVAAFYFGAKSTKEAVGVVAQVAAGAAEPKPPPEEPELPDGEPVEPEPPEGQADEAEHYGTASPVTGLGAAEVEGEESTPPLAEEDEEDALAGPEGDAAAYGSGSPVTGVGPADVEAEMTSPPLEEEGEPPPGEEEETG
jgi:hypothetical protein